MMTVHKIAGGDAAGYSAYLASREDLSQRGDYYLSPAGEPALGIGQWHGRAAAELGLVGGVTREQLLRVWEGKDPRTGEILIRRSARGEHVAAVDCTFSAPKSVSVVWALSDEPHRGIPHQETRHRSTVISTVTTALHPYAGHILDEAAAAKESDWDPEAFLAGSNSLFVIAPADSEADTPAPIVAGVLAELYGTVRRLSDARGGGLRQGTLWVLDEVDTLCPLPGLPQWMAGAAVAG